ncbi:MAG: TauD/TfdA family dioxygenase [Acetobacteraceae bacterium]
MTLSIRAIDPVSRPFFAGEVSGIDITRPLSPSEADALSAGMDQYGVLVFHDQHFTDETQLAFSRNFGDLETATGDIAQGHERRLSMDVNDISNLDKNNQVLARDDRRRLFGLGNRPVALGQFVQGGTCEVFAPVGAADPVRRRQHGIRRHARGL